MKAETSREIVMMQIYPQVEKTLKKSIKKIGDRKIFLWGTSVAGEVTKNVLNDLKIDFEGFIDGLGTKVGSIFCGKEVYSPDKIANKSDEYFIVIASSFYKSIKNQLYTLGYTQNDMCGTTRNAHSPFDYDYSIMLEITHRCNLNCHFCLSQRARKKSVCSDMPLETAKKIIDDAVNFGIEYFSFHGIAENTMHKDYIEIFEYAAERFKSMHILTNGHLLTKELQEVIFANSEKCQIEVCVSATGYSPETYNDFQGSGRNDNTDKLRNHLYKTLEGFIEERNRLKSSVRFIMRCIATEKNLSDFKDYVDFWKDKVDIILVYPMYSETQKLSNTQMKVCGKLKTPQVNVEGSVGICCGSKIIIGNAAKTPIGELLSTKEYLNIVESIVGLDYDNMPDACKNCMYLFLNDYDMGVNYLEAVKFEPHLDRFLDEANGRPTLLFPRDMGADELFYAMYVNKKLERFDLSISDPYEKGYYERFEIQQPSVEVFKDKFVICFNDYELNRLPSEIRDAAYKIVSVRDILLGENLWKEKTD